MGESQDIFSFIIASEWLAILSSHWRAKEGYRLCWRVEATVCVLKDGKSLLSWDHLGEESWMHHILNNV